MTPQPLHPAVVHFPIVLGMLLPLVAVASLVAARKGVATRKAWLPTLALAVGLAFSSGAALQTGESEEEVVERVVAESVIHEHEDAAELFLWLSVGTMVLSGFGMVSGVAGNVLRIVTVAASLAVVATGYQAGHTGGALVYQHGAASAHIRNAAISTLIQGSEEEGEDDREGEHERRDEDRG